MVETNRAFLDENQQVVQATHKLTFKDFEAFRDADVNYPFFARAVVERSDQRTRQGHKLGSGGHFTTRVNLANGWRNLNSNNHASQAVRKIRYNNSSNDSVLLLFEVGDMRLPAGAGRFRGAAPGTRRSTGHASGRTDNRRQGQAHAVSGVSSPNGNRFAPLSSSNASNQGVNSQPISKFLGSGLLNAVSGLRD
jgi:hypothetical protein